MENLILQKTFREKHLTKKSINNNGKLPKYHAEDTYSHYRHGDFPNGADKEITLISSVLIFEFFCFKLNV